MGKPKSQKYQGNSNSNRGKGNGKVNKKRPEMTKSKSLSDITEQKTPRKMVQFMKMKDAKQNGPAATPPPQLPTIAEEASSSTPNAFKREFGETFDQYNRRLDEEVRIQLQQTKAMPDLEPEWQEKKEAKRLRIREKRKARETKKKAKKVNRMSEQKYKKMEDELYTDKVAFGDVVLRPPELKVKPRGYEKAPTTKTYGFMKRFSMDGSKFVLNKKKKTSSSKPSDL